MFPHILLDKPQQNVGHLCALRCGRRLESVVQLRIYINVHPFESPSWFHLRICHLLSCPRPHPESGGAGTGYTHILIIESDLILHLRSTTSNRCQFQQDFNLTTDATGVFNSTLTRDIALPVNATIDQLDDIPLSEVQGLQGTRSSVVLRPGPAFDITMAAANEYGAAASCKLFGVEILNEGFGTSVDDSVLEMQATFVDRSL